ncbi:MAG: hypothetical protein RBG13Loki_3187 [Promethearchaeota archaeon CR_4]|nr:MAG: hypothetical protein RBG13Loki_3187 [Candidatus Lokiarchaeota archaeon CR_4]
MKVFFIAEAQRGHFSKNRFLISSNVRVMSDSPVDGPDLGGKIPTGFIGDLGTAALTVDLVRLARFATLLTEVFLRFRADFLAAAGFVSPSDILSELCIDY